jgi:undecaprenyl-diphosphatase
MDFISTLILGLIEGLTEFIPVSSTGHLIIASDLLNIRDAAISVFEVFIQSGAILAVVAIYPQRWRALFDFKSPGGFSGINGIKKIIAACLPVLFVGFLFHRAIKTYLFSSITVSAGLIAGGIIMILIEQFPKKVETESLDAISVKEAFTIGGYQCLALWPGVSRSASTIVGGMWSGLSRTVAAEFSFLIAVPVLLCAVAADLLANIELLSLRELPYFMLGAAISFIVAFFTLRIFISFLNRFTLTGFGWYRIALGMLILFLLR